VAGGGREPPVGQFELQSLLLTRIGLSEIVIINRMNWQKVYTVNGFWDRPRFGVADYDGQPHIYESPFDEVADDYSDVYQLSPINSELFELILRDWIIWEKWLAAFNAGKAAKDSHPCLPGDKPEHGQLTELIGDRFQIDQTNCFSKKAEFRQTAKAPRRLEVLWTNCD